MARDHRRLAAIVSFDVAGYSRLMGVDDSATLAALKAHRRELIDPSITEHDGRIVKTTGDGLLVEFSSVVDAVRCAVDVQRGMSGRNQSVDPGRRLDFRIGINVGDIIIDGDDIFGDGVNVAARLQALAEPGGICVSRVVRDQVLDKLSFAFEGLGEKVVKNIARPVEVYRVALDAAAAAAPPAPRTRWTPSQAAERLLRPGWAVIAVLALAAVGGAAWIADRVYLKPPTVTPYSIEDRRMTFAVLPFRAPPGDRASADVAAALTEATFAVEEGKVLWARMASHASVAQALQQHTTAKDITAALDVHFLIRGNVSPAAPGYAVELLVVDGANERVLDTRSLSVATRTVTARERARLEHALGWLTYHALEAEVARARKKPLAAMDVRDLSFRAYVDWGNKKVQKDEKGAYLAATDLLDRALALAPDDPLALYLTARVNLCDCVDAWSHNVEVQQAIGAAALEKYLRHDPTSPSMLDLKSQLYALHGRFDESLVIADSVLRREPEDIEAMSDKAYALLKLGRPQEALVAANEALDRQHDWPSAAALAAAIHYELAQYDAAVQRANLAITGMSPEELRNPKLGAVRLTLIAAQARLGHAASAKAALADFEAAVPGVRSIGAIRNWMHPAADLHGYEPLFDGLRLAGVRD